MGIDDEIARMLFAMRNRDEHMDACQHGCDAKAAVFCTAGRILDRQVTEALRAAPIQPQGMPVYWNLPDHPAE